MSSTDKNTPKIDRDDPMIAAEYALGLLEGAELMNARAKVGVDEDFAWRKDWWDNWFAPLTDDVAGMEPGADVWQRISQQVHGNQAAQTAGPAGATGAEVIDLMPRLRRWQWTAAITSAAAAVMLAIMVFTPGSDPASPSGVTPPLLAAADPLVAQVPIGDTGLRLDVTFIPESDKMLVGALGLTADGVHDHELWLVPDDGGELQSLGVVVPGEIRSMQLPETIAQSLHNGSGLVLTREPIGGHVAGEEAGPVVAEGTFSQV